MEYYSNLFFKIKKEFKPYSNILLTYEDFEDIKFNITQDEITSYMAYIYDDNLSDFPFNKLREDIFNMIKNLEFIEDYDFEKTCCLIIGDSPIIPFFIMNYYNNKLKENSLIFPLSKIQKYEENNEQDKYVTKYLKKILEENNISKDSDFLYIDYIHFGRTYDQIKNSLKKLDYKKNIETLEVFTLQTKIETRCSQKYSYKKIKYNKKINYDYRECNLLLYFIYFSIKNKSILKQNFLYPILNYKEYYEQKIHLYSMKENVNYKCNIIFVKNLKVKKMKNVIIFKTFDGIMVNGKYFKRNILEIEILK